MGQGDVYLLRALAFDYKIFEHDKALQSAEKLASDILSCHHADLPLSKINDNAFWLGLYLIKHPLYTEFVSQCPGFDAVKFPDEVAYISPTAAACFNSFMDALHFLSVLRRLKAADQSFSLLISPGKYLVDAEIFFAQQTDIVGNRSHQSLEQLQKDGMKMLEGSLPSYSVVLEFTEDSSVVDAPLGFSQSRLSFKDSRTNLQNALLKTEASDVQISNCFFGSEFRPSYTKSQFVISANSSFSLKDSVLTQGFCAVGLLRTKAVFSNNIIESYVFGISSEFSEVEMERVQFKCYICIACRDDLKVEMKKCVLQEEPPHFTEHVPVVSMALALIVESGLTIDDCIIGSDSFGRHCLLDISNSKFMLKNSKLLQKDPQCVIQIKDAADAVLKNNKFHFKKITTNNPISLVGMGSTDLLELCENEIINFFDILRMGIKVFDVSMPKDGIKPKSKVNLRIVTGSVDLEPKISADFKHVSVHHDRLGPEGSKLSKAGKRLCHSCSKVEPEGDKSFRYCGQCKIVSYCSKECQRKDWKGGEGLHTKIGEAPHKNMCIKSNRI